MSHSVINSERAMPVYAAAQSGPIFAVRCSAQTRALEDMSEPIPVLPLNSGSFDFTFSVDVFPVLLVLAWVVRRRHRFAGATP